MEEMSLNGHAVSTEDIRH